MGTSGAAQISLATIVLATRDEVLRGTRKDILSNRGYHVVAPDRVEETSALIRAVQFRLLIIGNSLEPDEAIRLAAEYRRFQPKGRIVEIVSVFGDAPYSDADATVVGLDGPPALLKVVRNQIGEL